MIMETLQCREEMKNSQQVPKRAKQWLPGSTDIHGNFSIIMSEPRISQKMLMKHHK